MSLEDLKLDSEPNIELTEIIPIKEGLEAEDEIASQVFLIARNLKRNNHTKDTKASRQEKSDLTIGHSDQYAKNVTFQLDANHAKRVYFDVSLDQTLNQLIMKVIRHFSVG